MHRRQGEDGDLRARRVRLLQAAGWDEAMPSIVTVEYHAEPFIALSMPVAMYRLRCCLWTTSCVTHATVSEMTLRSVRGDTGQDCIRTFPVSPLCDERVSDVFVVDEMHDEDGVCGVREALGA